MKPIKLLTTKQIAAIRTAEAINQTPIYGAPIPETIEAIRTQRRLALKTSYQAFPWPAVDAIVTEVNGRAVRHTHTSNDIFNAVLDAEQRLQSAGVTVANRPGSIVTCLSALPTAKSYNRVARTAIGSRFVLERRSSAWYLTSYVKEERYTGPGAHDRTHTAITPIAAEDIQRHAMREFSVSVPVNNLEAVT